jgi:phospholipid transport system substrate-binding protein
MERVDRRAFFFCCAFAAGALAPAARAVEIVTDSPATTIATLQRGLAEAAAQPAATVAERYRVLEPLIDATHDLPYIAEFALRRQWASLAEEDRERFVAAFRRLSVMTYAARFEAVGPDTFRPITEAAADAAGRAEVATAVARAGMPDVSLEYLLHETPAGWRIINIVADGVSDLALKRAEYQRLYANGGIDGLVAEVEAQTRRLAED